MTTQNSSTRPARPSFEDAIPNDPEFKLYDSLPPPARQPAEVYDMTGRYVEREKIVEQIRTTPDRWGVISTHRSAGSARQIRRRLKDRYPDCTFRVRSNPDGTTSVWVAFQPALNHEPPFSDLPGVQGARMSMQQRINSPLADPDVITFDSPAADPPSDDDEIDSDSDVLDADDE